MNFVDYARGPRAEAGLDMQSFVPRRLLGGTALEIGAVFSLEKGLGWLCSGEASELPGGGSAKKVWARKVVQ